MTAESVPLPVCSFSVQLPNMTFQHHERSLLLQTTKIPAPLPNSCKLHALHSAMFSKSTLSRWCTFPLSLLPHNQHVPVLHMLVHIQALD